MNDKSLNGKISSYIPMEGTLTKRMEAVYDEFEREFGSMCTKNDAENKMKAVLNASRSARPSRLGALFKIFELCGIPYEKDRDNAYYEKIVRNSGLPELSDVEDRLLFLLYTKYREYPLPENYMKRIVDRLSDKADGWEQDSLRLRILKQFIKYGNCLVYNREIKTDTGEIKEETVTLYGGAESIRKYLQTKTGHSIVKKNFKEDLPKYIPLITDDIFDALQTAKPDQTEPTGTFGLLKMADDLAGGRFKTGGNTKKSLYLFAMVYQMTFCSRKPGSGLVMDYERDIEINLFRDYYTNNLLRFLTKSYKENKAAYEIDPSGQGINYKNFAEVIYLYYLTKDLTPQEKIKRSAELIEKLRKIKKNMPQSENEESPDPSAGTAVFRSYYKNEEGASEFSDKDALSLSEEEFTEFLCEKYNRSARTNYNQGVMQLETEQNTAYAVYEELIVEMIRLIAKKKGYDDSYGLANAYLSASKKDQIKEREKWLGTCNYGLWFTDVAFCKKGNAEEKRDALAEKIRNRLAGQEKEQFHKEDVDDFICMLFALNDFMGYTVTEKESSQKTDSASETSDPDPENELKTERTEISEGKTKALFVDSAKKITRTTLLVTYYYYFNILHENDSPDGWMSFGELFKKFAEGANDYLERAYYQPIDSRNLLDILIVFSSYAFIVI